MDTIDSTFSPFKKIALCFSGGGFRAASFSLGVLSYLNHLQWENEDGSTTSLLDHVPFISSTSGGSITNILYSSLLHQYPKTEEPFYQCFRRLYTFMEGDRALTKALEILNDDAYWRSGSKTRNLINAFALTYDELLFQGLTFSIFWEKQFQPEWTICINTTEFNRGLAFRFQTTGDPSTREKIGNAFLYFDRKELDTVKKIKLADILAASSCFPSGFEPIIYPEDFAYSNLKGVKELTAAELRNALVVREYNGATATLTGSVGIMDGGITDNQALYSAMLADQRNKTEPFDLIMVNDVTSYFMDPYTVPKAQDNNSWSNKTLSDYLGKTEAVFRFARLISIGLTLLFIFSLLGIIFIRTTNWLHLSFFLFGFSTLGLVFILFLSGWIQGSALFRNILVFKNTKSFDLFLKKILAKNKFPPPTIANAFSKVLLNTPLGSLKQMVSSRLSSVVIMASEVNLKQVRRIIYELFYSNEKWKNRRISNFIYQLSFYNLPSKRSHLFRTPKEKKDPPDYLNREDRITLSNVDNKLRTLAEKARKMGTTLWFERDQNEMLDVIIQCGQFTTCYSLLEYTLGLLDEVNSGHCQVEEKQKEQLMRLKTALLNDWNHFNKIPSFLIEEDLKKISK